MEEKTICLTGHRPKSLPWGYDETKLSCKKFKKDLKQIFIDKIKEGFCVFFTGMAEGFDMLATELLLKLKKKFKTIKIYAIVPCKNQEIKWKEKQQKKYHKILENCDCVKILEEEYTKSCMNDRNKYMVKHSSLVIACFNGKPSGTSNTIKFAQKKDIPIVVINPQDYI